jgi:hypothetical protein
MSRVTEEFHEHCALSRGEFGVSHQAESEFIFDLSVTAQAGSIYPN